MSERSARLPEWLPGPSGLVLCRWQVGDASCGLHRRIEPDGLEIGYRIQPSFTGRGLATSAARLLTDAALAVAGIIHVEIHHDKADVASAGVPRRLAYRLVA